MTSRLEQLLDELAANHPEMAAELREEIEKPGSLWPAGVMEAVAEHVSPSVWNPESGTFKSLNKRITWAVDNWKERYGPLTDKQRQYMSDVLIWAVSRAAEDAEGDKRKLYAFINQQISGLVNHETVHAGFKKRADGLVDVSKQLAELAA